MAGQGEAVALREQLALYGSLVRFSHTIFALPFALAMAVFLSRDYTISFLQLVCILIALVSARTAAMSFNRLIDRHIDAKNPRTAARELPAGKIAPRQVYALLLGSAAIFMLSAAGLGWHCFVLSPLVLIVLLGYSLTKRFTSASHYFLGIALACAPGGVWYAITAQFAILPVWMMLGVLLWVAGFDILYSLQDQEFDKDAQLFSIPAKFGASGALQISRATHIISIVMFIQFGVAGGLGTAYFAALTLFSLALLSQHLTISPTRLDRIENAFFTRNAWASVFFLIGMILETLYR